MVLCHPAEAIFKHLNKEIIALIKVYTKQKKSGEIIQTCHGEWKESFIEGKNIWANLKVE